MSTKAATVQKTYDFIPRSSARCLRPCTRVLRAAVCRVQDTSKTTVPGTAEDLTATPSSLEMVQAPSALSSIPTVGYLAVFLTIFSLISIDVAGPAGLSVHMWQPVDLAVHNNVVQNVPLDFRIFTADKVISNLPIGMGALLSIVGLQLIISKNLKKGLFLGGLLGAFNVLFGGIGFGLDAQATALLKNFFQRARPSDLHHSFSFPSGHSTSVYFIAGFLFFVIVPALYETLREDAKQGAPEATGVSSVTAGNQALNALEVAVRPQNAAALTIAFGVMTQSGRLLADVHWTSDVMAGMMWGATGVAMACMVRDIVYKLTDMQSGALAAADSEISKQRDGKGTKGM